VATGLSTAGAQADADTIRAVERERLRVLVNADVASARRLHADDFQLIDPSGGALTKEQYLGAISSGVVDYILWEPDMIAVRVYGEAAVIRYRSQLEIVVQGQKIPRRPYWPLASGLVPRNRDQVELPYAVEATWTPLS
jgi:uncharacterized protein DUF4440